MATTTGSKRLLDISANGMAASNSMTYGGLNVATEQYVSTQVSNLVASAPGTLDTLNELAAALGDDPNFATTIANSIATKLDASVNPIKAASVSNDTITFTRADNTTFSITTSDANTDTNYYLNGITRSGNTLTFSVSGTTNRTYTFGSAAWAATTDFDASGAADGVNNRIDNEIIPLINGKADASHTHSYLPLSGGTITGALTVSGSTTRGTYDSASQYHTGADNIVLKGNASGISSIFFESEKNGTNINHPSDFGFIQYHPYGTSTSGESNELIIGVSNDADDHLVLNAPNTNGLKFRIGSSATDYTIYHSGNLSLSTLGYTGATNANYITNNNQLTNGAGYITGVAWGDVTGKPSTFAPSAHTHAISEVDGLQDALDAKQAAGSYAASNHNHTYDVNNAWLRDNGNNANVKLYGNSRQMVFRTDGTTEYASGVGGYAFTWMYGGDAAANRRMLLASDGRLWTSYHGWLDTAFASASHNHDSSYDASGTAAAEAGAVNTRIDEEVIPAIDTKADANHNHTGVYLPIAGKAADSDLLDGINSSSFLRSDATDYITNTIYFRGDLVGGDDGYRDHGVFGNYDSYKTDHIWSMGTSYRNHASGTNFGNLYGLAYKHTNNTTGGTMAGGHQMVWCTNGNPKAALGESGVWTSGHGTSANWKAAYDNYITGISITGTTTKTITLTQRDGGTISDTFSDLSGAGGDGNDFLINGAFDPGSEVLTLEVANQAPIEITLAGTMTDTDTNTWRGIHDTPVNGATTTSISSNWAFDNVKTPVPAGAVFTDNNTTYSAGTGLTLSGTTFSVTAGTYAAASHNHTSLNLTGSIYNGSANYSIDLKDHSDRTWFRNQVGGWTFQAGTSGDDWTQSFTFYLPAAGTTANNVWAEFGQRDSNDAAAGRYRGLRIVKDTGSVADGDLRAGAIYIGTTRRDANWTTAYNWGNHASAGYASNTDLSSVNDRIDNEVFPAINDITLASLGYTGATNANYITNNNQLTNGAGYITDGNTGWNNTYGFITASSTDTLTNKSGNISQWTNDSGYLTSIPTTLSGNRTIGGDLTVNGNQVITAGSNADVKFSVWSGTTYGIGMTSGVTYGGLNDYAMTFCMNNDTDRGFWWGYSGQSKSAGAMSLTTAGVLTVASSITAGGDITAFSDIRVKENIKDLEGSLDKVTQLRGVSYNKIGSEEKSIGVIAQEIQEVLPEVVREGQDGMLSVAYGNITAVLIEAVKELTAKVESLEEQLKNK